MHGARQFFGQHGVDQAMTLDTGKPAKVRGNNGNAQVKTACGFAVTGVAGAVVGNNERFRFQRHFEFVAHGGEEIRRGGRGHGAQCC